MCTYLISSFLESRVFCCCCCPPPLNCNLTTFLKLSCKSPVTSSCVDDPSRALWQAYWTDDDDDGAAAENSLLLLLLLLPGIDTRLKELQQLFLHPCTSHHTVQAAIASIHQIKTLQNQLFFLKMNQRPRLPQAPPPKKKKKKKKQKKKKEKKKKKKREIKKKNLKKKKFQKWKNQIKSKK